jgi:hypothetical protein
MGVTISQRVKARRGGSYPALICSLLAAIGCTKTGGELGGELIGVYSISGALVDNSCGLAALPTQNPLRFEVEIRMQDGVGYWQMPKRPAQSGEIEEDGSFVFKHAQTSLVSSMRAVRDLEPQDFDNRDPDFDLRVSTCSMKVSEVIEGTLARSFLDLLDGGTGDSDEEMDLKGDNRIEVEPTEDSDCSRSLAALGGSFNNLPCGAHYKLKGELLESKAEP